MTFDKVLIKFPFFVERGERISDCNVAGIMVEVYPSSGHPIEDVLCRQVYAVFLVDL